MRHVKGPATYRRFTKPDSVLFPVTCWVWSSRKQTNKKNQFTLIQQHSYLKVYPSFRSSMSFFWLNNYLLFCIHAFEFFLLNAVLHTCLHCCSSCWFQIFSPNLSRVFRIRISCTKQKRKKTQQIQNFQALSSLVSSVTLSVFFDHLTRECLFTMTGYYSYLLQRQFFSLMLIISAVMETVLISHFSSLLIQGKRLY